MLTKDPRNPGYNNLKAAILARIGELQDSIEIYAGILAEHPAQPKIWLSYGHALKSNGRESDSIAAYNKSIELLPGLGEAYWSLANLKTAQFTNDDVEAMQLQLRRPDLAVDDQLHLHFAMGKALEDRREFAASFEHYAQGNRLRRAQLRYEADEMSTHVRRVKSSFSAQLLCRARRLWRRGAGSHIHSRFAEVRFDPARADFVEPFAGRGHDGAAGYCGHRAILV